MAATLAPHHKACDDAWRPEGLDAPRTVPVTPAARLARPRRWPGVVAWTVWALAMVAWLVIPWLDDRLRQAGPT
jgi:hypothetical protein